MGKRDTKAAKAKRAERRGKGSLKTEEKTNKSNEKKDRKEANRRDQEDLEVILKEFTSMQAAETTVKEELVPPPPPRCNGSLTAHPLKDELFFFGGEYFDGKRITFYAELLRYSIKRNEWRKVTTGKGPPPRSAHQAVAVPSAGGQLFIFGGEFSSPNQQQFHHYRDLWSLDLSTLQWENHAAKGGPSARSGHRMVHVKDKLLLFGGFFDNLREVKYYNDVHLFDLSLYKWSKIVPQQGAPVPAPRSGCGLVADASAGVVLLYGGYFKKKVVMQQFDSHKDKSQVDELCETGVEFKDLWQLDIESGEWTTLKRSGAAPSSRSGCAVVLHRRRLVLFGGVHDEDTADGDGLDSTFYNELYSYALDQGKWHTLQVQPRKAGAAGGAANADGADDGRAEAKKAEAKKEAPALDAAEAELDQTGLLIQTHRRRNRNRIDDDAEVTRAASGAAAADPPLPQPAARQPEPAAPKDDALETDAAAMPCPRMNCAAALRGSLLFVYGGLYEPEEQSEITLNDMWSLDLAKLDRWNCLHAGNAPEESIVREASDDDDDGDDSSSSSGSSGSSGSADESDDKSEGGRNGNLPAQS